MVRDGQEEEKLDTFLRFTHPLRHACYNVSGAHGEVEIAKSEAVLSSGNRKH